MWRRRLGARGDCALGWHEPTQGGTKLKRAPEENYSYGPMFESVTRRTPGGPIVNSCYELRRKHKKTIPFVASIHEIDTITIRTRRQSGSRRFPRVTPGSEYSVLFPIRDGIARGRRITITVARFIARGYFRRAVGLIAPGPPRAITTSTDQSGRKSPTTTQ